jgi:DNA-binding PadR family transcriptional regulator
MAVKHIIMAALARHSMHGYGVHEALKKLFGSAWPTTSAHVYATLAELARGDLVSVCSDPTAARARRKQFSLTEQARRDVEAWLTRPAACAPLRRSELLAKLATATQCGAKGFVEWLRIERAARARRIARFRREMSRHDGERGSSRLVPRGFDPTLAVRLTCARRLAHLRVELDLLDALVAESAAPERPARPVIPAGSASR